MDTSVLRELVSSQEKIWLSILFQSRQVRSSHDITVHLLKAEALAHQALLELQMAQNKAAGALEKQVLQASAE